MPGEAREAAAIGNGGKGPDRSEGGLRDHRPPTTPYIPQAHQEEVAFVTVDFVGHRSLLLPDWARCAGVWGTYSVGFCLL